MRIVYGVSGEGLGHVFEAREIATLLRTDGHAVKILTYGDRACEALADFHPTRIEGLPLSFSDRGLSLWATLRSNRHVLPFFVRNWSRLKADLIGFQPDVFLTAYEPYTTLMAHVLSRPLISMDNQNALRYLGSPRPGQRLAGFVAKLATRICTYGARHYIIKSYRPVAPRTTRDHFVAPLVQRDIRALSPTTGEHLLVYLTKPNPSLIQRLRELNLPAVIYCWDRTGTEGRLEFRRRGSTFLTDLATCRAIIGTAGFSLIADARYLGKPYFAVPLKRQFEQTLNGDYLRQAGFGDAAEEPSLEELRRFIAELPRYRRNLASDRFDPLEQATALRRVLRLLARDARAPLTNASPLFSAGRTGKGSYSQEKA